MSPTTTEADVFLSLANWLEDRGYQFYVNVPDAHHKVGSYVGLLDQYPTHSISIGPYKPDFVGFNPSNRVFAIEVKGENNLRKGLGQAISYQRGVDQSYLAADKEALNRVRDLALSKGIGVLGVTPEKNWISQNHPYSTEMKDLLYNTRHQLENLSITVSQESRRLPNYADPLNQLMPVIAIAHHSRTTKEEIGKLCEEVDYPYRRVHERMIRLADFLGMIRRDGDQYHLTDQGEMCQHLLQGYGVSSVSDLKTLKERGPLWQNHPPIATYLRNRFASVPDFRTLFEVLLRHGSERISILELCETLIVNYPSTFLNLIYSNHSDNREAPELIEQGRGSEIYDDPDYLVEIIHSQFISNTASQFRSLGILTEETPVIEPKSELDPENNYWYPREYQ